MTTVTSEGEEVWQRRSGAELREWERRQPEPRWRRGISVVDRNQWGEDGSEYMERLMWGWDPYEWRGSPPERAYRARRRRAVTNP